MSSASHLRSSRLSPVWRRGHAFARDEDGVTAVEFGLLALPFFAIIAAIFETAIVFLAGQILDTAVQDSARLIRTGQAQSQAFGPTEFRGAICSGLVGMFDCSKLRVSVTTVTGFDAVDISYPLPKDDECTEENCDWTLPENYTQTSKNQVVLVQAYYKWPTVVNIPGFNMQALPDGTRLLGAVRVFMNEPFE